MKIVVIEEMFIKLIGGIILWKGFKKGLYNFFKNFLNLDFFIFGI